MVGILNGKQLTLYLDRAADNAPVTDAQIELEIGGAKVKAEKHEDAYEVVLAAEPKPGVLPVTATVTAGAALMDRRRYLLYTALGGVLCRCTGYRKIVEAVLDVAGSVWPAAPEAGVPRA